MTNSECWCPVKNHIIRTHLINGKANGLKVAVKPLLLSSILLHEPHQKGAPILPIQGIIIHILQTQHKLRVGRECGWSTEKYNPLYEVVWQNFLLRHPYGFSVTSVIEAAASSGADPPCPVELVVVPAAYIVTRERVWGQVTDLQLRELPDEVWIGHPEERNAFTEHCVVSHSLTSHLFPSLRLRRNCCFGDVEDIIINPYYTINKTSKISTINVLQMKG